MKPAAPKFKPSGNRVPMGKDKRVHLNPAKIYSSLTSSLQLIYVPSRFLLEQNIRLDGDDIDLLFSMCLDRHLIIYPNIYANDTAFEVQDKIVIKFESKSPPIRMSQVLL